MDEGKKPTIAKLTQRIWARYQRGSERHQISPRDVVEGLGACINASLTAKFDYRSYLLELPKCDHVLKDRPDLKLMSTTDLMQIPRDEAMRLIEDQLYTALTARSNAQRREAALRMGDHLDTAGPIIPPQPLRLV